METKGKKTKGKQKIEMKKVEAYGDRMITFSKRKSGIYKKMSEIITMCDAEVAFLVFSQSGKPYTFAHPSMEEIAERLKNPNARAARDNDNNNNNTDVLVEAYKKKRIEELMKKYEELLEELETESEKVKLLKESRDAKELEKLWWNFPAEGLSKEELERRYRAFMELHDGLCDMALSRLGIDGVGSSSGGAGNGLGGGDGGEA